MQTVLIAIHLMIVVALVAVVLLQRSEGGALGVGGGNSFMTGRGQANVLTRATAILAAAFFATSLGLTLLARYGHGSKLDFNAPPSGPAEPAPKLPPTQPDSILDQVRRIEQQRTGAAPAGAPAVPTSGGSSATPAAAPAPATPPAPAAAPAASSPQPAEPSGMPSAPNPAVPAAPDAQAPASQAPAMQAPAPQAPASQAPAAPAPDGR